MPESAQEAMRRMPVIRPWRNIEVAATEPYGRKMYLYVQAAPVFEEHGYKGATIKALAHACHLSPASLYHYFGSKEDLLEAVVDRIAESAIASVEPILSDPQRTAPEKLRLVFSGIGAWKADRRELMLALLDVWLSDHNAVVREKLRRRQAIALEGILDRVVGQGLDEGTFRTGSRDHVAGVLAWLLLGAGDTASRLFLERRADSITFTDVEATLDAYREAIERILGAAPGSLVFMDDATLHLWFD